MIMVVMVVMIPAVVMIIFRMREGGVGKEEEA